MSKTVRLKKGFNINLLGEASNNVTYDVKSAIFALKPTDFINLKLPKLLVKEGDQIQAGDPVFYDKSNERVKYTSPVSGEVAEIRRGDKRKLLEIKILSDEVIKHKSFDKYSISDIHKLSKDSAKDQMIESGVWPNIIQRPYAIVANPDDTPKSIFISAFDTHPLSPDYSVTFKGEEHFFEAGIEILKKFTDKIHISVDGSKEVLPIFTKTEGVEVNKFFGSHPAGCVGVQIHHIDPISTGETVWTISPFGVIQIGKLFLNGIYDASKVIAFAGSKLKKPQYYKTYIGACVDKFLKESEVDTSSEYRVISGNVLTGEKISNNGFVGFYDQLVTVIPEGNKPRFFLTDGWLSFTKRLSFHRAWGLLSFINGRKGSTVDTNKNGEERAFVMTGAFEKVVPMDILPTHLIKAILAEDFEGMEALGIFEVSEEDLALCEFIDVSKHDIQKIVRKGINLMIEG